MSRAKAINNFQTWLISQGYTREHVTWGAWVKDGVLVTGKLLVDKMNEFKLLKSKDNE